MKTKPYDTWEALETLVKEKGALSLSYDAGGGGMCMHWCACVGHAWPWCGAETAELAIRGLIEQHARLDLERSNKAQAAIFVSSQL